MNALRPISVGLSQLVAGADPPTVCTRWTNVVSESVLPPVGPAWVPAVCSFTHGIAPAPVGSGIEAIAFAHTMLVSRESSQVARDDAGLVRVGAEEVRGELVFLVTEQRGLRRKQRPGHASKRICRLAHVVLCADAPAEEKSHVA